MSSDSPIDYYAWAKTHVRSTLMTRDQDKHFDRALWKDLAKTGFFRSLVPKIDGGLGLSATQFTAAFQALAKGSMDIPFVLSAGAHGGVATSLFLSFATAAQKRAWLPYILHGDRIAALCNAEPGAGTDIKAIKSKLTVSGEGQGNLELFKGPATNLSVAEILFASVWVSAEGLTPSLEVLLLDDPGAIHQDSVKTSGFVTGATGSVKMSCDLAVTKDSFLGGMGNGIAILKQCFNLERFMIPVIIAGVLEGMVTEATQRVLEAKAFGKPIATFQYIQDKVLKIYTAKETVCGLVRDMLSEVGGTDFPTRNDRLSNLKMTAVELGFEAAVEFYEIYGGLGYLTDHMSQKLVRDFMGLKCLGGTKEQQKMIVFNELQQAALQEKSQASKETPRAESIKAA